MATCEEVYAIDVQLCDAQFTIDWDNAGGDPDLRQQAIQKHKQCQDAAWLKYINCSGQSGGNLQAAPADGGQGCGCEKGGTD